MDHRRAMTMPFWCVFIGVLLYSLAGCTEKQLIVDDNQLELHDDDQIYYLTDTEEPFTGILLRRYETGENQERICMKNGLPNGSFIKYYEDGTIKGRGEFKNGEMQGIAVSYRSDGTKHTEIEYKDGVVHGRSQSYHSNGTVETTGRFSRGVPVGVWRVFNIDGDLLRKIDK